MDRQDEGWIRLLLFLLSGPREAGIDQIKAVIYAEEQRDRQ